MTFGPVTVVRPGANATIGIAGPRGFSGQDGAPGATGQVGPASLAPIQAWQSGRGYLAGPPAAFVSFGGSSYACSFSHTSGTFTNDLANRYWVLVAAVGSVGPQGTNGSTWYSGPGAPSNGFGVNGDYYFRTDTCDIYINTSGTWGSPIINIKGTPGNTVNSGSGAPSNSLGVNGDFYIDTANSRFYGPKAAGAWPLTYLSLIGPPGPGSGSVNPTGTIVAGRFAVFGNTSGTAIADPGFTTGVSVANPGTATLEALLAPQSVTGASHVFAQADLFLETRRSNNGSAMADTFPAAGSTGLVNGTRIVTNNVDGSAPLAISAGSGTLINGALAVIVGPGRSVDWIYDTTGGTPTWRSTKNGLSGLVDRNALSEIAGLGVLVQAAARQNLGTVSRGRVLALAVAN